MVRLSTRTVSMLRVYLLLFILSVAGGGIYYVQKLQSDLETARANVVKMEEAVKTSEASLRMMEETAAKFAEMSVQLQEDLQKAEQYGDELRNTLNKHNLTHLANKKPGLIEKRMQDATNKLWDDLELITDPSGMQSDDSGAQSGDSN
jgi:uncharacterized protein HemX